MDLSDFITVLSLLLAVPAIMDRDDRKYVLLKITKRDRIIFLIYFVICSVLLLLCDSSYALLNISGTIVYIIRTIVYIITILYILYIFYNIRNPVIPKEKFEDTKRFLHELVLKDDFDRANNIINKYSKKSVINYLQGVKDSMGEFVFESILLEEDYAKHTIKSSYNFYIEILSLSPNINSFEETPKTHNFKKFVNLFIYNELTTENSNLKKYLQNRNLDKLRVYQQNLKFIDFKSLKSKEKPSQSYQISLIDLYILMQFNGKNLNECNHSDLDINNLFDYIKESKENKKSLLFGLNKTNNWILKEQIKLNSNSSRNYAIMVGIMYELINSDDSEEVSELIKNNLTLTFCDLSDMLSGENKKNRNNEFLKLRDSKTLPNRISGVKVLIDKMSELYDTDEKLNSSKFITVLNELKDY